MYAKRRVPSSKSEAEVEVFNVNCCEIQVQDRARLFCVLWDQTQAACREMNRRVDLAHEFVRQHVRNIILNRTCCLARTGTANVFRGGRTGAQLIKRVLHVFGSHCTVSNGTQRLPRSLAETCTGTCQ
eukprot:gene20297-biopygen17571